MLGYLAWRSNESGLCWPSVPNIASWTGLSLNTVRPVLKRLEQRNCFTRNERHGQSTFYHLNVNAITEYTPTKTVGATPPKSGSTSFGTPTNIGGTAPTKSGGVPLPKLGGRKTIDRQVERQVYTGENPEWYSILYTLSDQVPSYEHCQGWLDSKSISTEHAENTALAMKSKLRYEKDKWWMDSTKGKVSFVTIWGVFQVWAKRESFSRNGRRPKENDVQTYIDAEREHKQKVARAERRRAMPKVFMHDT